MGFIEFDSLMFFSPIRMVLFIGWFYSCISCVKYVEYSRVIPEKLRLFVSITTLFLGPLVVFSVRVIEFFQKCLDGKGKYHHFLGDVFGGFFRKDTPTGKNGDDNDAISLLDSSGRTLDEIYRSDKNKKSEKGIIETTEQVIADAIKNRASDILIDPRSKDSYEIRFRVDGVLCKYDSFDSDIAGAIINSIKAISKMDISERRRPQDGSFSAKTKEGDISLRVASAGVFNGEKLSLRVLDRAVGLINLENIGMSQKQYKKVSEIINRPSGLVLLCGPTGSGKSTTLYSILRTIDSNARNIITVEDPVEYNIANISQIEVNQRAEITFAKALRSILRQDPDVICIGEIRDEETAGIALQAAQTGHLVIATMHSNSNLSAMVRLLDLGTRPLLLSQGLTMVISQRLIRRLCSNCKSMETLSTEQIQKLGTKKIDYKNICRPNGCVLCDNTGYKGRTGIYDVMVVDENIRKAIMAGKLNQETVHNYEKRNGKSNLKKEAMKKVLSGVTTWQEVKRVVVSI